VAGQSFLRKSSRGELGSVSRRFNKQSEVAVGKPFGGRQIELIGVRFDGMGRIGGQARAPSALRAAGLCAAVGENATMGADVLVSEPRTERAATSGLRNETALLEMIVAVQARVGASLVAGRFPLVYGGDCAVLLVTMPALRTVVGEAGLVFIDGHEDATSMEASLSGEAANMEIALLLGHTGEQAPRAVRAQLPALNADGLAMLGQRDDAFRRVLDVRRWRTACDCARLTRCPRIPPGRPSRQSRMLRPVPPDGGCTPTWMC
jgi:arginase family enzyme